MEPYKIITIPHPTLREAAKPVSRVDDAVRHQIDRMLETMYAASGIGLAANQVDMLNRVIVVDVAQREEEDHARAPIALVNPEIVWQSDEAWSYKEGCLSIPGHYADVTRPYKIRVKYLDRAGQPQELEGEGLMSSCLQHEIDHLNGVLFIDHLSRLKRNMIMRKIEKNAQGDML